METVRQYTGETVSSSSLQPERDAENDVRVMRRRFVRRENTGASNIGGAFPVRECKNCSYWKKGLSDFGLVELDGEGRLVKFDVCREVLLNCFGQGEDFGLFQEVGRVWCSRVFTVKRHLDTAVVGPACHSDCKCDGFESRGDSGADIFCCWNCFRVDIHSLFFSKETREVLPVRHARRPGNGRCDTNNTTKRQRFSQRCIRGLGLSATNKGPCRCCRRLLHQRRKPELSLFFSEGFRF